MAVLVRVLGVQPLTRPSHEPRGARRVTSDGDASIIVTAENIRAVC